MEVAAIFLLMFSLLHFRKCYAAELDSITNSRYLRDGDTLVSATGIFELGFFKPDSSENKYLGIWYKNISVRTVVWVANRDSPIPAGVSTLVLKIADQGNLILFNNKTKIWSSNTNNASRNNATAKLHDSGNLVLSDQKEKMIWQSFDYPTDTQLPGMKIGRDYVRGIEWRLSSWKSSQDPAPGEFTWGADTLGYPENKIKQGSVVKYRGGPWTNQRFTGVILFNMSVNYSWVVVLNNKEKSFTYINEKSSMLTYASLNSAGQLENWVWIKEAKKWQLSFSLPGSICDSYNTCKAYGSCVANANNIKQSCTCLDEKRFVPRDQKGWDMNDWSSGCVRRTPLDCSKYGSDKFIKYSNVNLPDTESTWFNMSMSLEECEMICLRNCSCMAYTYPDLSLVERGCLIWLKELIDIRVLPQGSAGRDIFVRMASSELAVQPVSRKKGRKHIKIILLVIFLGVLPIGFISIWFCYRRIKRNRAEEGESMELPLFSFSTIAKATANFSPENKLGEGGFGLVYKGVLEEGQEIAVKRLSKNSSQGLDEFKNEVICISKLQHRNLVKLLGCCIRGDEKLLIYEYMPNRSLDSNIFDRTQCMFLDWTKRFNIIKGIARGLVYLHQDSRLRIIHRDLKASNILLDQDMNPKISDFGIARSFGGNETEANTERVVGTYGYMSPEYALDGIFSIKSDVFSFGVLVLEIVSGKKNRGFIQAEHENNLIGHAWSLYTEGRAMELMDDSLAKSCHPPEVLRSIEVGLLCVQQNASDRPDMPSVIMMLGGQVPLPQPKQPAFFVERELPLAAFSLVTYTTSSINEMTITEVDAR